ncbi:hypothetical protein FQA39_LY11515 [Lamprigera yunnana]|nr:hypothetical protein FQA39_LY11515 [Lamprigera yunnana]
METEDIKVKLTRSKSRSIEKANSPHPINDINVNGEDDLTINKQSSKEKPVEETSTIDDKHDSGKVENKAQQKADKPSLQGRKRKASEMKDEELASKDKSSLRDQSSDIPIEEKENKEHKDDDMGLSLDIKDINLQTLGKGKRARIPNKRYSDFPLKSSKSSQADNTEDEKLKLMLENGESKELVERETGSNPDLSLKDDESEKSSSSSPNMVVRTNSNLRSTRTASPSTPGTKKAKPTIDLNNPNYLKPFQFGWKRELVYRTTNDVSSNKRNGDIYYYTPNGRKVRSMREVSENLKNKELSLDDFTFFKEPLGLDDPEKEIIRDAKIKSTSTTPSAVKKSTPKITRTSKVSSPKATPAPESPTEVKAKSSPRSKTPFKIKLPTRGALQTKSKTEKKNIKNDSDMDIGTYPPNWSSPVAKKGTKTPNNLSNVDKPCRPCSIRCQGVSGIIPTLQCRICLCLYHYECVGLPPHSTIEGYVCKNCQLDQDSNNGCTPTIAPPPLTPINALKSIHTQSTVLPKLQRIPRTSESELDSAPVCKSTDEIKEPVQSDLPRLTPRPTLLPQTSTAIKGPETGSTAPPHTENKSIVGSVTTWFPSSSTIQVSEGSNPTAISETISVAQQRPQHVEFLGKKQFLIIPKQNVLAISPNIPTSATAPATKPVSNNNSEISTGFKVATEGSATVASTPDAASLGPPVEVSTIKTEPLSPLKFTDPQPICIEEQKDAESDKIQQNTLGKRPQENLDNNLESKRKKPKLSGPLHPFSNSETVESAFMESFLQNVAFGYSTLQYVFQYLKVQDLLRASCVCSMWRDIASHPMLWKTVRMKNSQIHSFEGLADALQKHGTVHLDLRKMLLPSTSNDDIWVEFSRAIKKVDSLRKIELCRCPATVVEQLALSNSKLEVINSVTIKCENMSLAPLSFLTNLQELRLKSTAGFSLTSDLTALSDLCHLKHLSLTSIKELNKLNIEVIADLRNLESLELGECTDFPKTFGSEILTRLSKLEKLRLEKGQGNCYTFEVLEAVKNMPHLYQLELVNFDIKPGFDLALGACPNIKKLLIIPTYISQSATTNHMVLGGVLRLQSTLSQFVWGVTLELLRVTELFVDQCEEDKEKKEKRPIANGDSIPVLKPVPLAREGMTAEILPAQEPPQVEILPLPNLQKLLLSSLPTTRVKILKIPFHATWRQSIHDSVN